MIKKEERLKELFNKLFKILNISYSDFNKIYEMKDHQLDELMELKKEYPELDLFINEYKKTVGDVPYVDGVSVITLFSTITQIFCGKKFRIYFKKNDRDIENSLINGCGFVDYNDNPGEKN